MLYLSDPGTSDQTIVAFLDFAARARGEGYWDRLDLRTPWIVGSAPAVVLSGPPLHRAIASGVIRHREEEDRGVRRDSYDGRGVAEIEGEPWFVQGTSAHDDRNHDFVSGRVSGRRVFAVDAARCLELAQDQEPQLALVLHHCAGQSLEPFDAVPADAAQEEVLWRMARLRWFDLRVEQVDVADEPFFVTLRGRAESEDARGFGGIVKDGRFTLERIPRAGASALHGQSFSLPSSGRM